MAHETSWAVEEELQSMRVQLTAREGEVFSMVYTNQCHRLCVKDFWQ